MSLKDLALQDGILHQDFTILLHKVTILLHKVTILLHKELFMRIILTCSIFHNSSFNNSSSSRKSSQLNSSSLGRESKLNSSSQEMLPWLKKQMTRKSKPMLPTPSPMSPNQERNKEKIMLLISDKSDYWPSMINSFKQQKIQDIYITTSSYLSFINFITHNLKPVLSSKLYTIISFPVLNLHAVYHWRFFESWPAICDLYLSFRCSSNTN